MRELKIDVSKTTQPIDIKFSALFLTIYVRLRGVVLLVGSPLAVYYKSKMAAVAVGFVIKC